MNRRTYAAALGLALCVTLAACGGGAEESHGPTADDPVDVSVGIVPFAGSAPLFHAMDSGIFQKHGLNVTVVPTGTAPALAAGVVSGNQQFAFMTTPGLISANNEGISLKCVAPVAGLTSGTEPANFMVSAADSGITSIADLSGKKFALSDRHGLNGLEAQKLFTEAGVTDVEFVTLPFPQMAQALADGRVDAATITSLFVKPALDAGANVLAHPTSDVFPDSTIYCYSATSSYLEENADVATAFLEAMSEAITYAKDHEAEVKKSLVKHLELTPKAAQAQALAANFVPEISVESIAAIQAEMLKQGAVKESRDVNDLVWEPAAH